MGQEAQCTARFGRQVSGGKALLETDALIFRGLFRLAIRYKEITSVRAKDGNLVVRFSGGLATFDLGAKAERWAEAIRSPKSLIDKLGIKPGASVAVLGVPDPEFARQLRARTSSITDRRGVKDADAVILGVTRAADLRRLESLVHAIKPEGAIWVVHPKGVETVREADVLAAGKPAGLVDVKVVRFSETHTAHKFVIPVARRGGARPRSRATGRVRPIV